MSSWIEVAQFTLTKDWQFSDEIVGRFFKVRHLLGRRVFDGWIAQADIENPLLPVLSDIRELFCKEQGDLYEFTEPIAFGVRALAVKRLDDSLSPWVLAIDILDFAVGESPNVYAEFSSAAAALTLVLQDRGLLDTATAIAAHEAAVNPHPEYLPYVFGANVNSALAAKADLAAMNTALAAKADLAAMNTALALKADLAAMNTALAVKADLAVMNTALALKADLAVMNTALALKADLAAMNTALALKADLAAMNTALALKADLAAMNAALAAKANLTAMNTALALKADLTAMNTALALKADLTAMNTALALKADLAVMNTALAAKADLAAMNTALALKADLAAMNTALALKADLAAMNTALALKADLAVMNTALALKADLAAMNTALAAKANLTAMNTALALKADLAVMNTALAAKADLAVMNTALAAKADLTAMNSALAAKSDAITLSVQTSDATLTEMVTPQRVLIHANSSAGYEIQLTGHSMGTVPEFIYWLGSGAIYRGASPASTILNTATGTRRSSLGNGTNWTPLVSADTVNGGLKIQVKGDAAKVIKWVASIKLTEVW